MTNTELHAAANPFPRLQERLDGKTSCTGLGKSELYMVWPSARYPGYFYVDHVLGKLGYAEGLRLPVTQEGVLAWLNYCQVNEGVIRWSFSRWDGEEYNPHADQKE